ncbi:MAG TPA: hypothetical protein VF183_02180 [Acidimicrobiales bacterium]
MTTPNVKQFVEEANAKGSHTVYVFGYAITLTRYPIGRIGYTVNAVPVCKHGPRSRRVIDNNPYSGNYVYDDRVPTGASSELAFMFVGALAYELGIPFEAVERGTRIANGWGREVSFSWGVSL